jgi:flagellin-specific chaperone FliS
LSKLPKFAQDAYQQNAEATEEGAFNRLIETYNLAILAGIHKDKVQAQHVLALLVSTLNPEPNPELSLSLHAIYSDCSQYLEQDDYAAFTESIERLKGLWTAYYRITHPS